MGFMPCGSMKWSMRPSESQVMSEMMPWREGNSPSRCTGMMGKSWSMAQESGRDWKTLKLP